MVSVSSAVQGARHHGHRAGRALSGHHLELLARAGYATKGVLYAIIGVLAINTAMQGGGQTSGSKDAIAEIASQPFGMFLLGVTAFGLFAYALWRFAQGILDLEHHGRDGKGLAKRIGAVVSGVIHAGLGVTAARMLAGSGGGGGSSQGWTASLMQSGAGRALIGVVGAIIIGYALYEFGRALKQTFMKRIKTGEMSAKEEKVARLAGRIGLTARGVVYLIIGSFFIQAAWQRDSSEVGGLDKALSTILQQPYGPWLLGLVAVGLIAYAAYCAVQARYRTIPTHA